MTPTLRSRSRTLAAESQTHREKPGSRPRGVKTNRIDTRREAARTAAHDGRRRAARDQMRFVDVRRVWLLGGPAPQAHASKRTTAARTCAGEALCPCDSVANVRSAGTTCG